METENETEETCKGLGPVVVAVQRHLLLSGKLQHAVIPR